MNRSLKRTLLAIVIIPPVLLVAYGLTQDLPVYDQFYTQQERNERDLKRIVDSLPERFGDYVLESYQKYPFGIQAHDECYDANGQGAQDPNQAVQCARAITADYRDSSGRDMSVNFVSMTKGVDAHLARNYASYRRGELNGYTVYRWRKETDNTVLWYPVDSRNPILKRFGWYPEKTFLSIQVLQGTFVRLKDGSETHDITQTIDTSNPIISYFLKKYPPAQQN